MNSTMWKLCKSYLSFRDLCTTRPVCKEWMDIRSAPFLQLVYFFEDAAFVNLPSSDDPNFRKCLLAAKLTKLHCQIFTLNQLQFVLQILDSLEELTFELDAEDVFSSRNERCCQWLTRMFGMQDYSDPDWNPDLFRVAKKLKKLELCVTNCKKKFIIDFEAHPKLVHIESNVQIELRNYDDREMDCVGLANSQWTAVHSAMGVNTELMRLCQGKAGPSLRLMIYLTKWAFNLKMKPLNIECQREGLTFFHLSKGIKSVLTAFPVFQIQGTQKPFFTAHCRMAYGRLYTILPNLSLEFHSECSDDNKKTWVGIVNESRQNSGLLPLKIEDVPVSHKF